MRLPIQGDIISILIINGPNLNLLGTRETRHYGSSTLEAINGQCQELAKELKVEVAFLQSNHEGTLVDSIQDAERKYKGIILNAGAYTHTSIALADAILGVRLPVIEVHLSNIYKREGFRHQSHLSPVVVGGIFGLGPMVYLLAIRAMVDYLDTAA